MTTPTLFDELDLALAAAEDAGDGPPPEVDEAVREVFREEAVELLGKVERLTALGLGQWPSEEVVRHAHRLFHTLAGAARTAGFDAFAEVSAVVEFAFLDVKEGRAPATPSLAAGAQRAVEVLRGTEPELLSGEATRSVRERLQA